MQEIHVSTPEERAESIAAGRAYFGDRYEQVCRDAYARSRIARQHRLAAERGDWSWKSRSDGDYTPWKAAAGG